MSKAEKIALRLGLTGTAKASFIQLCDMGCDPEFLADYLPFLISKTAVKIRPKNLKRKSYGVDLRPLDSYEKAIKGFDKDDLEALAKQILKVAKQVERLNRTMIVRYTEDEEYHTDIFAIPKLLAYYGQEFIPLLLKKYSLIGRKQSPQYRAYINRIINHVESNTGAENYRLMCDVLEGFGIYTNEGALKQKRYRDKGK